MTHPPITARTGETALVRVIGTWGLAAGIINIIIGGGIFRLPADVAAALGAAAPLAYLVCVVAVALIMLCVAEAGSRVARTGGVYAYIEVAFGPFVGFVAGVLLWLLSTFAFAAVATVLAAGVGELVPAFASRAGSTAFLLVVFAVFAAVNIAGVRQGALVNSVSTIAKLLPLVLLVVVGAFHIEPSNLAWPGTPATGDVARTAILLIFAFAGAEAALLPSGEVKDPARTVPRALGLALTGIALVYVSIQLTAQGILGDALATSTSAPLADAAGRAMGSWGRALLLVGATISMLGYVSGMTLAVPRALYALARDGFFPAPLAAVHPRFRTPHVAIVVQTVFVALLALTSSFERLAILANLSLLVLYAMCSLASWQLRRRDVRTDTPPFVLRGGGLIPFAACAVIAFMLTSVRPGEWLALAATLAGAAIVFVLTRGRRAAVISSTP
jgi:amino acid transporter